jgi:hypothetical protein
MLFVFSKLTTNMWDNLVTRRVDGKCNSPRLCPLRGLRTGAASVRAASHNKEDGYSSNGCDLGGGIGHPHEVAHG